VYPPYTSDFTARHSLSYDGFFFVPPAFFRFALTPCSFISTLTAFTPVLSSFRQSSPFLPLPGSVTFLPFFCYYSFFTINRPPFPHVLELAGEFPRLFFCLPLPVRVFPSVVSAVFAPRGFLFFFPHKRLLSSFVPRSVSLFGLRQGNCRYIFLSAGSSFPPNQLMFILTFPCRSIALLFPLPKSAMRSFCPFFFPFTWLLRLTRQSLGLYLNVTVFLICF